MSADLASPRYTLYTDEEIAALPVPPQLIEGVMPTNGLVVLFGEKGSMKTFLALDIAAHVSLGLDWHGHRVAQGTVVYVYAEGRTGLGPRLAAWKRYYGARDLGILFLPQRITVNERPDCAHLILAIEKKVGSTDCRLIILDTLNRNSSGNESSTEDMSEIVRGCDFLRENTGATILMPHHKGYQADDRSRGSSVLDAAADTVISVTRDAGRITIECKKQKDAAEFGEMAFEAVPIAGSLVLKASGPTAGKLEGQRLLCLRRLTEESTDEGLTYSAWHTGSGITGKSSFDKARKWLHDMAYVTCASKRWSVTDAGTLALRSTESTTGPLDHSGPSPSVSPLRWGYANTPAVDLDQVDHAGDSDWQQSLLTGAGGM